MSAQPPPHYTTAEPAATNRTKATWFTWSLVVISIAVALLGAYYFGRSHGNSNGQAQILIPTPAPFRVQIDGEVQNPGVHPLESGDRIIDAIEAAGGTTQNADLQKLNLAAFIRDGAHIVVPHRDTNQTTFVTKADQQQELITQSDIQATPVLYSRQATDATQSLLNINIATREELMSLPNIGAVRANQIIEMRERIGGFTSAEQLTEISGIGAKTLEAIQNRIVVQ